MTASSSDCFSLSSLILPERAPILCTKTSNTDMLPAQVHAWRNTSSSQQRAPCPALFFFPQQILLVSCPVSAQIAGHLHVHGSCFRTLSVSLLDVNALLNMHIFYRDSDDLIRLTPLGKHFNTPAEGRPASLRCNALFGGGLRPLCYCVAPT